jgi:uncharacterized membrane protein
MNVRVKAMLVALAVAMVPSCAFAYQAQPLNFCNNTADRVVVAVGYHSPDPSDPADHALLTGPYSSKGWYQILAGTCQTIDNPFEARYMFWFAWSKGFHDTKASIAAMAGDADPADFCVSNYFASGELPDFSLEDENVSGADCRRASGWWITPNKVDTWMNANVSFNGY